MAIILSTDPKIALWMITGLFLSSPSWLQDGRCLLISPASSLLNSKLEAILYNGTTFFYLTQHFYLVPAVLMRMRTNQYKQRCYLTKVRLKRIGSWKSSWIVAHWWYRPMASLIWMSICKEGTRTMSSASPTGSQSEHVAYLHRMTYLWSVEGSIARVKNPFLPKFIQAVLQLLRKQVFKVLSAFNWDKTKTKIDTVHVLVLR